MDIGTIIGKTFSKRFRGIDPDEVDFFLREVADYVSRLQKQIVQLEQKIKTLEFFSNDPEPVETGNRQPDSESKETETTGSEDAVSESHRIIRNAEEQAARLLEQSGSDLAKIRESIVIMQAKKESIGTRLKMLLQSELELIKSLEAETGPNGNTSEPSGEEQSLSMSEVDEIIKTLDMEQ